VAVLVERDPNVGVTHERGYPDRTAVLAGEPLELRARQGQVRAAVALEGEGVLVAELGD